MLKKFLVLFILGIGLIPFVSPNVNAAQVNAGDRQLMFFNHAIKVGEPWQYGTWNNDSSVDRVYARAYNNDNLDSDPYNTDADVDLQLWHVYENGNYSNVCSKHFDNLQPGEYFSCYTSNNSYSWDKFRTAVKVSDLKAGNTYLYTGIAGGYQK